MPISFDYSSKYDNIFSLANDAKEVLELLHKGVEERCFIAFPAVDNAGDTHPLSSPDEQLYVLKTYPILDSDQPYIPMPDEIRNTVLSQSLNSAQEYIKRMEDRAKDDYYHIMVVGDINSGKSAFINGLLRRDILPSGGRSLTSTFVEVLDAQDLDGNEEVHLCRRGVEYDRENEDTFERVDMANLYDIMCDWHEEQYDTMYDIIKVYVDHRRIDDNFLGNIERKIHIIDSVGLNTNPDAIRFLFEKQQEIDVLILTINATYGLTKSSTHIMKNYCEKRTKLFVVVTHPDCVCVCNDECIRSCEERRKQKFKNVIEEISPETAASADELIHYVNPTLVPMWDNESGSVVGEIPPEWSNMEDCLRTFICGQFEFHKLSPIVNYLQKVTHDVTLLSKLNLNMLESRFDEKTEEIIQLQDSISQLETRYDEVYLEARDIINKTITDIQRAVLKVVNDLKDNPEELVNREMIDCMGPGITADELQRLLQEKWKELEELYKQALEMYIQTCTNEIEQLVEGLPKDSTDVCFTPIKLILQDVNPDEPGVREPEQSLKYKVEEMAQQVLEGSVENSKQAWGNFMCQILIDKLSKYTNDDLHLTMNNDDEADMSSDEKQVFGQKTPFDDLKDLLAAMEKSKISFRLKGIVSDTSGSIGSTAGISIACTVEAAGIPAEAMSIVRTITSTIVAEVQKYFEDHFEDVSVDETYETVEEIVREVLSRENFAEDYATRVVRVAEERLFPLLDNQIGNCYAAAITEQMSRFIDLCAEVECLNKGKVFFQQLNEKVTQIQTSMEELQL